MECTFTLKRFEMSMIAIYTNSEVLEKMEGVEGQLRDVLSDYYRRVGELLFGPRLGDLLFLPFPTLQRCPIVHRSFHDWIK